MPVHRNGLRLRPTILADQLGAGVGGGRFTTEFLRALLNDPDQLGRIEHLHILRTQDEPVECLGSLPANVGLLSRRFPARLRRSQLSALVRLTCPPSNVAHGLFFYVFPHQARSSLVTVHDVSFLVEGFHPSEGREAKATQYLAVFLRCQALVCSSDATLRELTHRWPALQNRLIRIYCGTAPLTLVNRSPSFQGPPTRKPFILAVGTIEPRKNYDRLLDSFEYLLSHMGDSTPELVIVGSEGWMCQSTVRRLRELQQAGKAHWLQQATDDELSVCYHNASLFTYLSLYEGFGYPPFEAAYAGTPMVLSNQSSVGEIWRDYACCVDPTSIQAIVKAWQWALSLNEETRALVVERQAKRAAEFSWRQCVAGYLDLYEQLAQDSH